MMNTSFLGLDTTLKYPYKDPKFFPNSSRNAPVHRQSLPNLTPAAHASSLSRNQTFSHTHQMKDSKRVNGAQQHVVGEFAKF